MGAMSLDRRLRQIAILVAALLAAAGVTVIVTDTDDNGTPDRIVVTVDGAGAEPGEQPVTVDAPTAAVEQAQEAVHDDLRTEDPDGVSRVLLDAAQEQQDRLAASDQLPIVTPNAAPEQDGCSSRFVANKSSRRGVRPRLFVLHYTVSPNRPGRSDVDAITTLFDRPAFAASSHYIIDRDGFCAYIVRESDKAWTQATFNPVSISVEIINSGQEASLTSGAGRERLIAVTADSLKRWDIPARQATVRGCTVERSGIIDHAALGACGGGHSDVNPYRAEIPGIIRDIKARQRRGTITGTDIATCRKLNAWRAAGRPHGGKWELNSVRRRKALDARGVTCTTSGPVRR